MAGPTRIFTDIDYERNGKQIGYLGLPHSVTRSAYGNIMIPLAVVKNGSGPTAFFMAGNHGDEYEGQVALNKFIRAVEPARVQGRILVLPAANLPAALAGTRVSPIDDRNMNRAFPGDPDGTITEQIAYYIDSVLFPLADLFADWHSGGSSLDFIPWSGFNTADTSPELLRRSLEAAIAVGAPLTVNFGELEPGVASFAAALHGVPKVGGEFGGGGSVSLAGVRLVEQGLLNLLAWLGIMGEKPPRLPETRLMATPGLDCFVHAPEPGLFEPFAELGDTVEPGQPAGQMLFVDNPAREPVPVHFKAGGTVICRRHFGRAERGDCLYHLAIDWDGKF
jgi:hypothetical protein